MKKTKTFKLWDKASASLCSVIAQPVMSPGAHVAARATGMLGTDASGIPTMSVIVEANDLEVDELELASHESVRPLADGFYSAVLGPSSIRALIKDPNVDRIQSKKLSAPHLDTLCREIGIFRPPQLGRVVPEDGRGVVVGVVDTGFDLSHPAFRDPQGQLRVLALLDQERQREYTTGEIQNAIINGDPPGADAVGHGTHVASIAAGSAFSGLEGIAPAAQLLLVRTNFVDTDEAVTWIFEKAGDLPCVVNMSLGHHMGAHDGTDEEERLHRRLIGPGRIIVVSAGNEREDAVHCGSEFHEGQTQEWPFEVLVQEIDKSPYAHLTVWHDERDGFEVSVVTPAGRKLEVPALGQPGTVLESAVMEVKLSTQPYVWSHAVKAQVSIALDKDVAGLRDLRGWVLRLTCRQAVIGRIDAWFNNSSYAQFVHGAAIDTQQTIGLPATGEACICVASHVSCGRWESDEGAEHDPRVVVGRSSRFSSLGPTRDGRPKPEVSAPGQYVRAALADGSNIGSLAHRTFSGSRLVTLEGTSMAAPVVSGLVALMLQKRPGLTVAQVRDVLTRTAKRDGHTGQAPWNPAYGFGKIHAAEALAAL